MHEVTDPRPHSTDPARPLDAKSMRGRSRLARALVTAYRVLRSDPQRMSPEWYAGAHFMANLATAVTEYDQRHPAAAR